MCFPRVRVKISRKVTSNHQLGNRQKPQKSRPNSSTPCRRSPWIHGWSNRPFVDKMTQQSSMGSASRACRRRTPVWKALACKTNCLARVFRVATQTRPLRGHRDRIAQTSGRRGSLGLWLREWPTCGEPDQYLGQRLLQGEGCRGAPRYLERGWWFGLGY